MEEELKEVKTWVNFPWQKAIIILLVAVSSLFGLVISAQRASENKAKDREEVDKERIRNLRDLYHKEIIKSNKQCADSELKNIALNRENDSLRNVILDAKTEGLERVIKIISDGGTSIVIKPKRK